MEILLPDLGLIRSLRPPPNVGIGFFTTLVGSNARPESGGMLLGPRRRIRLRAFLIQPSPLLEFPLDTPCRFLHLRAKISEPIGSDNLRAR